MFYSKTSATYSFRQEITQFLGKYFKFEEWYRSTWDRCSLSSPLQSQLFMVEVFNVFTLNLTVMYSSVSKYLDSDTFSSVLALHSSTSDMKVHNDTEVKVLPFPVCPVIETEQCSHSALSVWLAGLWVQTLCTATATCSGCQTGWRAATRSLALPAVPGPATWRTNCCSPRLPRSSPAQVNIHCPHACSTEAQEYIHMPADVPYKHTYVE